MIAMKSSTISSRGKASYTGEVTRVRYRLQGFRGQPQS